jgi:hypothetical protein
MKSSNPRHKNPLAPPRTAADFLARWPGATCTPFKYAPGMSVLILRLADGMMVATGYREAALWDKGMSLMEQVCTDAQRRVYRFSASLPRALAA